MLLHTHNLKRTRTRTTRTPEENHNFSKGIQKMVINQLQEKFRSESSSDVQADDTSHSSFVIHPFYSYLLH